MTNGKNILPFTQESIDMVADVMVAQDVKGLEKYGQALDPMDSNYDWLQMTYEELADALKYLAAEAHKKRTREDMLQRIRSVLQKQTEQGTQQVDVVQLEYALSLVDVILALK